MALHAPGRLLAVLSTAAIMFAACTSDRDRAPGVVMGESNQDTHDHGKTAKVSQDLSVNQFYGTSLPAKTLALTFDDGPGPRTKELSSYLKSLNIQATFFMNGARLVATALPNPNGITVVVDPIGTLQQVLADGHLVANHTTTHRYLTSQVPDAQRVQELSETDTDISGYVAPQNHLLFRAPYGDYNSTVYNTLSVSTMNKYIGPINWDAGGYSDQYPSAAADWACWQGSLYTGATKVNLVAGSPGYATTTQCGDAYLTEINAVGKGIVLMHDPYSWAQGSTVDMVKYILPQLIAAGYSFVRADDVPAIAAALPPPPCDPTCATCSGPGANQCTACLGGRYKSAGSACLTCTTCASNQYQSAACTTTADTACGACNAGCATCSGPSASQCTSCAGGKYLSGGQCLTCSACSASEYLVSACTANANTACGACNASCETCTGPSATECASCSANKYLNGGACTACSVCGSGTYQSAACNATTNTACGPCDASCTACSGPNPNQCGSCPASFFLGGGVCNACKVCEAGTFQTAACTTTANATCTACPAGSFTKVAGATTCTKCEPGTTSAAGAKACTPCAAGHVAAAAGATTCSACAAGTFAATGATTCSPCPAGTSSGPGAAACTACGNCDDGNACTQDRCDTIKGCVHDAIVGCETNSGTSGGVTTDAGTDAGAVDAPPSDDGCSVSGRPGRSGSGREEGALLVLAALGMSLLVRRRRQEA